MFQLAPALPESDSKSKNADNVVTPHPFIDPEFKTDTDVLPEPVRKSPATMNNGLCFIREKASHAEQKKRIDAARLPTVCEMVTCVDTGMAEVPAPAVSLSIESRYVGPRGESFPEEPFSTAAAALETSLAAFHDRTAPSEVAVAVPPVPESRLGLRSRRGLSTTKTDAD
jgi:hypothetical protein